MQEASDLSIEDAGDSEGEEYGEQEMSEDGEEEDSAVEEAPKLVKVQESLVRYKESKIDKQ